MLHTKSHIRTGSYFEKTTCDPNHNLRHTLCILAHGRTSHTAVSTLQKMESMNAVHGLDALKSTKKIGKVCEACVNDKFTNQPHALRQKSTRKALELMHTDLCGPINPHVLNGEKYVQLLTDDSSGAMWSSHSRRRTKLRKE